ncbi:MAG: ribonuclease P protein component [Clostridia bacterium]|nr:ribonuclease P protein component [Clostridia bacterium]
MRKIDTLKKNYEFKNVINRGKFYRGKYVTIYITKNKEEKNKIGIAISKKLAKANKRNRLKRLIRESYYLKKDELEKGHNIVFIWNRQADILNNNFKNVSKDILKLFEKAGLI